MSDKLNLYQKLQKSRVDLQKKDIKKSGYNKYSNYNYFELSDFLPHINEVCLENGLSSIFHFRKDVATLTIKDTDNLESVEVFTTPVEIAALKGCSSIQNIGGTQSYARRYLYMMAFEIAESDSIDGGQVDQDAEEGKKKINKASVFTIKKLIDETGTDESKFLSWAGTSKIEDITNDMLGSCISLLNKKKDELNKSKDEVDF